MSRKQLRVGAVSYLNTKPLVFSLAERAPYIDLEFDLPSRLADRLARAELDVALIPSIEYLLEPSYTIVSDACIACRGPVFSVKLLSRVPMAQVRRVAMDEGSRTSIALARILLRRKLNIDPMLDGLPIGASLETTRADAVLLIGDRAIHPPHAEFQDVWDLGDQWCRWAELPFVFAMWTARAGVDTSVLAGHLEEARDAGCQALPEIARQEADSVQLDPEVCLSYLRDNLHFYLGPRERRGLERFCQEAAALDLVPPRRFHEISGFHDCKTS
jgi:chorismate dehydratase